MERKPSDVIYSRGSKLRLTILSLLLAFLCVCSTLSSCSSSSSSFVDFYRTDGYRVVSDLIGSPSMTSSTKCVVTCNMNTQCRVVSYSSSSQECSLSSSWYTDPYDFRVVEDTNSTLYRKSPPSTYYDDPDHWILVFRAHAESGLDFWGTWSNVSHHDDDFSMTNVKDFPMGCVMFQDDLKCDRFYRSQLLENWTNVDQVQIAYFTEGTRVAYVTFDTRSSTEKSDFMNSTKIIDTSITEFKGGYNGISNYFSVNGTFDRLPTRRRFYMSHSFAGCQNDISWMFVAEGGPCTWDKFATYPAFLYTTTGKHSKFYIEEPGRATVFALLIKKGK